MPDPDAGPEYWTQMPLAGLKTYLRSEWNYVAAPGALSANVYYEPWHYV
jgi:hypothetical protein